MFNRKLVCTAILCLLYGSSHSVAARTVRGKASIHGYSGVTTAARGVRMGATLLVWDPRHPRKKIHVKVVDACGMPMRRMGRVLDLSPRAARILYGTSDGVHPVAYRLVKQGKGQWCGRAF